MAVKKQPESETGHLSEAANDWLRIFLKHLEDFMVETGQGLPPDADYRLATVRAFKLTLLESGIDDNEIVNLFGRVALEDTNAPQKIEWNAELNKRRFELIDGDIQGTLSRAEQIELAGLTQLMREQADSEANLPIEGAKKLHRLLSSFDSEPTDSNQ